MGVVFLNRSYTNMNMNAQIRVINRATRVLKAFKLRPLNRQTHTLFLSRECVKIKTNISHKRDVWEAVTAVSGVNGEDVGE